MADYNEERDGVVRKTEGGRVQGRAVVSRFIGQGCGGWKEAQMGRTLPLCNRNTHPGSHTKTDMLDAHSYTLKLECF